MEEGNQPRGPSPTTPKAVVFDLGKVLVDFDYRVAVQRLAKRSDLSAEDFFKLLNHNPTLLRYEAGGMSTPDFFAQVKAACGFRGDLEEFKSIFGDIFTPIPPMIDLQAQLRQRGVPTYVFSNTNEIAIQFMQQHFPFFRQFEGYVYSYQEQAMKPEARMYEAVERRSGRRGAQLLYFDDRPENITGALARGWQAFVHEDPEKSRAIVVNAGLLAT